MTNNTHFPNGFAFRVGPAGPHGGPVWALMGQASGLKGCESFPKNEEFEAINKYIDSRKKQEYEKIISGENKEIEKRYDRYVDYG